MWNMTHANARSADQAALIAALDTANARAYHSYFTQYVLTDSERGYIAIDEGDYGTLPAQLMDRVIDAILSRFADEI
ncbi:MAG: hypothetical protein ACK5NN_05895 [Sphingomonadaceae bacterium]